jgi:hypothetical protein
VRDHVGPSVPRRYRDRLQVSAEAAGGRQSRHAFGLRGRRGKQ